MSKLNNKLKQYCILPIALIRDVSISDRARFVFCWMASMPRDWEFYMEPMAKELGFSVGTLRKYLYELVESGWIVKGQQDNNGHFGAVAYTLNESKFPSSEFSVSEKTRYGKNTTLLNKDSKPNRDIIHIKDSNILGYDIGFVEEEYRECFVKFLKYRKAIKKPYVQESLESAYLNLKKLSNNNPDTAREIVEQSIANQWQGLFELKTQHNNGTTTKYDGYDPRHVCKFTEEDRLADDL